MPVWISALNDEVLVSSRVYRKERQKMECRPYLLRIGYKWLNLSCHGKKYIIFILVRYLRLVSRDDPGVTHIESSVSIYGDIQLTPAV